VGTADSPFDSPGGAKVSWSASNVKTVTLSIDGGQFQSGLPAKGSLSVPFQCSKSGTNTHTYTISGGGSSKSTKASAKSDQGSA
jgi:hypothetical protein